MAEAVHPPVRILIVDDEPQIRSVLHDLFSDDHKCVEAASAEESLPERLDLDRHDPVVIQHL